MNLMSLSGRMAGFGARVSRGLCVVVASLTAAVAALAVPSLNVSPATLAIDSTGEVSLHVTGLTSPGQTVLIERYLDVNADGTIDSGDRLVQSSRLTDGSGGLIGGQRNRAMPADEDGAADSQLTMRFSLPMSVELGRMIGGYLVRVSSPTAEFAAFTQPFTVTQTAESQAITGTVTSDGVTPVPYALVGVLSAGDDGEFLRGVAANASGQYTLNVAVGSYQVLTVAPGFLANMGAGGAVTVAASQQATSNQTMVAATRTISGRLEDAADPAVGLAGVQLFVQAESGLMSIPFTDASGNFSVGVTNEVWMVEPSSRSLGFLGFLGATLSPADTTTGNVSGFTGSLPRATALFHGTVTASTGTPLAGVYVQAQDMQMQYEVETLTDSLGRYSLAVTQGQWQIRPDSNSPGFAGLLAPAGESGSVTTGQAVEVNFVALAASAHLRGTATNNGSPAVGVAIGASLQNANDTFVQTVTDGSGNFDLGVTGGTWQLQLENSYASQHNLVGGSVAVTVANDGSVEGINFPVRNATGVISGQVTDGQGAGLSDVNVYAFTTIGGVAFNAGGRTNASGHYTLPVINGTWNVGVSTGNNGLTFTTASAVVSGPTTTVNFSPLALTAHFQGTVTNNGVPVSGVQVGASLQGGGNQFFQATTDVSGNFDIALVAGTWTLNVQSSSLAALNLIAESRNNVVIADQQTISNLALRVRTATGAISGTVRDLSNATVSGAFVNASITIENVTYSAFGQTNGSGQYSLPAIDGEWMVNVFKDTLTFAPRPVVVSGSASADFAATVFSQSPFATLASAGSQAGFSVQLSSVATGASLQWQVSTDFGATWTDVPAAAPYSGVTTTMLSINPTIVGMTGYRYRCVATGTFGTNASSDAILSVTVPLTPPQFSTQPGNQSVSLGQPATFGVQVTGTPAPSVQWQLSTDSGNTWNGIGDDATHSGTATPTLTVVTASPAQNGHRYRALAENSSGSQTSNVVTLTLVADFSFWRASYFTPTELANPAISGPTAIYGQDGLTNLTKYALGLDPTQNATSGLPVVTTTASEWIYTYTRPAARSDLVYSVEVSTNLSAWTTSGVTHELVSTDAVAGTETWRARYPLASAATAFFRLQVTR